MSHVIPAHVSSTMDVNLYLFPATLHLTTLPSRTQIKEQEVVVIVAVAEDEALLSLHELLLRQGDDVLWRRRRKNIAR